MPRDPRAASQGFHPNIGHLPFSHYARDGWSLEVECWRCKRAVYFGPAELLSRFGAHASTASIAGRLVCDCGTGWPSMRAVIIPA